ncbi:MAG: glycosyltransferase family 2 protein, partial [Pseudanabaena sp.]
MSRTKTVKPLKKGFARSHSPIILSACLIVKNEEQRLPQCLESLLSLADEIIVVDTGSLDRTVAIAKKYQARVFHFAWCDDFSQARNYAIAQAKGKWILVIDADEVLEQSAIAILQEVLQREDC